MSLLHLNAHRYRTPPCFRLSLIVFYVYVIMTDGAYLCTVADPKDAKCNILLILVAHPKDQPKVQYPSDIGLHSHTLALLHLRIPAFSVLRAAASARPRGKGSQSCCQLGSCHPGIL